MESTSVTGTIWSTLGEPARLALAFFSLLGPGAMKFMTNFFSSKRLSCLTYIPPSSSPLLPRGHTGTGQASHHRLPSSVPRCTLSRRTVSTLMTGENSWSKYITLRQHSQRTGPRALDLRFDRGSPLQAALSRKTMVGAVTCLVNSH